MSKRLLQLEHKLNCLQKKVNNLAPTTGSEDCVIKIATQTLCVTWAEAIIADNPNPNFLSNKNMTSVDVTGGSGANGNGRIYTLTFPAHPNGDLYIAKIQVWDDTQADTGLPEIISQTATTLVYQLPQGDDGGSEDDNDYYKHSVIIESAPVRVLTDFAAQGCTVYIDGELVN